MAQNEVDINKLFGVVVVAEAREWGRQRLEERLRQLASESGEVFSPEATQAARAEVAERIGGNKTSR